MNRGLGWGAGIAVIAATVALVVVNSPEEDRGTGHVIPTLGPLEGYAHVALPVTAPPDGALVFVTRSGDPEAGEQIAFQYSGYSIDVCTFSRAHGIALACKPQPGQGSSIVRRYRHGEFVTRIFAYGKFGESATGPAAQAAALFETATLVEQPVWLKSYTQRNNERLAG